VTHHFEILHHSKISWLARSLAKLKFTWLNGMKDSGFVVHTFYVTLCFASERWCFHGYSDIAVQFFKKCIS